MRDWNSDTILLYMKSIHSIYIAVFIILLWPSIVFADKGIDHSAGYCQNAKTTADLVTCTKTRLDAENKRLDQLFKAVQAVYETEPETQAMIAKNQEDWIQYRTRVCAVEGKQYEGGSLALVQETSCLARVASDRANHYLVMLRARDDSAIPVFSNPPRWVNVLGEDYEDIFWAISSKRFVDTDCDGVDEVLLSGLHQISNEEYKNVVAIADSKQTGRPKINLLEFDDMPECSTGMEINVQSNDSINQGDGNICKETVSLMTKNCGEVAIKYDSDTQEYKLEKNMTEVEE